MRNVASRIYKTENNCFDCLATRLNTSPLLEHYACLAILPSSTLASFPGPTALAAKTWVGLGDVGPGDVGPGDVGPGDVGLWDVGPGDVGPGDVGLGDVGPGDMGPGAVGPGDVGLGDA